MGWLILGLVLLFLVPWRALVQMVAWLVGAALFLGTLAILGLLMLAIAI